MNEFKRKVWFINTILQNFAFIFKWNKLDFLFFIILGERIQTSFYIPEIIPEQHVFSLKRNQFSFSVN